MIARLLRSIAVIGAVWMLGAGTASAQAPVLTANVANATFSFNWTATAGATGYSLDAGLATSGSYQFRFPLGNLTAYSTAALNGVFFVRIVAHTPAGDVASNEVTFRYPTPPAVPTNLIVARNGTGFVATWAQGVGGSPTDRYQIQFGLTPGTTIVGFDSFSNGWGIGGVPPGTYYARVVALNAIGPSSPSAEVTVTMPVGGACDAATSDFFATTPSGMVSIGWTAIPGTATFVDASLNGTPLAANVPMPARITLGYVGVDPNSGYVPAAGTYAFNARTIFACGSQATRSVTAVNNGAAPEGPRTPNAAAGQLVPVPNYLLSVVNQVAAQRPGDLRNSCRETGGTNRFLFELVRALRARDTRWGLNIKRGYQGMSQDIVTYNRSALQDEGATTGPTNATRNISLFDVISGHCGGNPAPFNADVTGNTIDGGARAVWTLAPYLDAGYKP